MLFNILYSLLFKEIYLNLPYSSAPHNKPGPLIPKLQDGFYENKKVY